MDLSFSREAWYYLRERGVANAARDRWAILGGVFELTVETRFSAAHALMLRGEREPLHGHDWRVRAIVEGTALDADGLLCDFHAIKADLESIIAPFQTTNLNESPAFASTNASAEAVARFIGMALADRLPDGIRLRRLAVTEAPGCEAAWCSEHVDAIGAQAQ